MIKLSHNIGALTRELEAAAKRSQDWTPLGDRFKRIIQLHNARAHRVNPIGSAESTGRLKKSVERLDIWKVLPLVVLWGTAVVYAHDYAELRREQGMGDLLVWTDELAAELLDTWANYVLTGAT